MASTYGWLRWMAVPAMVVALTGCGGSGEATAATPAEGEPEEDAIAVRAAEASLSSLSELYSTTATLRADKQATVTARTVGVVQELLVEEGDLVTEGQALARLENEEQRISATRARSTAETRQREFERAESLHEQGLLSDEAFDTARRESQEAQHSAELADLEHRRTTIRAPFTGRVLQRHIDAGATVSSGTAVYDLADLDPLYADIGVPERHVARLAVGQTVRLNADAFDHTTEARIERIAPLVDIETGTVKVTLAVRGGSKLRPGTFVRTDVVIDTHHDALVVPRSALVSEGRRWHVFRVDDAGTHVERIEVQPGFEEGDRVEIAGSEADVVLTAGDSIVVVGAAALSDGARVDTGSGREPS